MRGAEPIPEGRVGALYKERLIVEFGSEDARGTDARFLPHLYARSISTYPRNRGTGLQYGEPNTDAFHFRLVTISSFRCLALARPSLLAHPHAHAHTEKRSLMVLRSIRTTPSSPSPMDAVCVSSSFLFFLLILPASLTAL